MHMYWVRSRWKASCTPLTCVLLIWLIKLWLMHYRLILAETWLKPHLLLTGKCLHCLLHMHWYLLCLKCACLGQLKLSGVDQFISIGHILWMERGRGVWENLGIFPVGCATVFSYLVTWCFWVIWCFECWLWYVISKRMLYVICWNFIVYIFVCSLVSCGNLCPDFFYVFSLFLAKFSVCSLLLFPSLSTPPPFLVLSIFSENLLNLSSKFLQHFVDDGVC